MPGWIKLLERQWSLHVWKERVRAFHHFAMPRLGNACEAQPASVEPLEPRMLFSGSTLPVLEADDPQVAITFNGGDLQGGGADDGLVNAGGDGSLDGAGGDDLLSVLRDTLNLTQSVEVDGGAGDDMLFVTRASASLEGGEGYDTAFVTAARITHISGIEELWIRDSPDATWRAADPSQPVDTSMPLAGVSFFFNPFSSANISSTPYLAGKQLNNPSTLFQASPTSGGGGLALAVSGGSSGVDYGDPSIIAPPAPWASGDLNLDGVVNDIDIDLMFDEVDTATAQGAAYVLDPAYDVFPDGKINSFDVTHLIKGLLQTAEADANLDRVVDTSELAIIAANFGMSGRGWATADFDGSGTVGTSDLAILASVFNVDKRIGILPGVTEPESYDFGGVTANVHYGTLVDDVIAGVDGELDVIWAGSGDDRITDIEPGDIVIDHTGRLDIFGDVPQGFGNDTDADGAANFEEIFVLQTDPEVANQQTVALAPLADASVDESIANAAANIGDAVDLVVSGVDANGAASDRSSLILRFDTTSFDFEDQNAGVYTGAAELTLQEVAVDPALIGTLYARIIKSEWDEYKVFSSGGVIQGSGGAQTALSSSVAVTEANGLWTAAFTGNELRHVQNNHELAIEVYTTYAGATSASASFVSREGGSLQGTAPVLAVTAPTAQTPHLEVNPIAGGFEVSVASATNSYGTNDFTYAVRYDDGTTEPLQTAQTITITDQNILDHGFATVVAYDARGRRVAGTDRYANVVRTYDSVISHWQLDDLPSSTSFRDSIGGHDAIEDRLQGQPPNQTVGKQVEASQEAYVHGFFESSVNTEPSHLMIEVDPGDSTYATDSGTVSFFFRDVAGIIEAGLFSLFDDANQSGFELQVDSNTGISNTGRLFATYGTSTATLTLEEVVQTGQTAVHTFGLNRWNHAAFTWNAAGDLSLYMNGVEIASLSDPNFTSAMSGVDILFGATRDTGSGINRFSGDLDNVAFFDAELSADEIRNLYEAEHITVGLPTNQPPTINLPPAANAVTNEDTPLVLSSLNGNAITVSDPDVGANDEVRVTLTLNKPNHQLTLATTSGLTAFTGDTTSQIVMLGTLTNINAALDGLTYTPSPNENDNFGATALNVLMSDLNHTGTGGAQLADKTLAITVRPVNDQPSLVSLDPLGSVVADPAFNIVPLTNFVADAGGGEDETGGIAPQSTSLELVSVSNPAAFAAFPEPQILGESLAFKVADGFTGDVDFTFLVRDSGGTDFGGVDASPTFMRTLTIEAPADPSAPLDEVDDLVATQSATITLPASPDHLRVDYTGLSFDDAAQTDALGNVSGLDVNDAFEIAVLVNDRPMGAVITPGSDAVVNMTQGKTPYVAASASLIATDANSGSIYIDVSSLSQGDQVTLIGRIVNNDSDNASTVTLDLFESDVSQGDFVNPGGGVTDVLPIASSEDVGSPNDVDFTRLVDVSNRYEVDYGLTTSASSRTNANTDVIRFRLGLEQLPSNAALLQPRGDLLLAIPLPQKQAGDTTPDPAFDPRLINFDGFLPTPVAGLPAGTPYVKLSSLLESTNGFYDDGARIDEIELAFEVDAAAHARFDIAPVMLAEVNAAPVFTSEAASDWRGEAYPIDAFPAPNQPSVRQLELLPSNEFSYQPSATDPDGDRLTYAVVAGPSGMGATDTNGDGFADTITWTPTTADVQSHQVTLRVIDEHGYFDAANDQTFTIVVPDSRQNRPPVFDTTPGAEATIGEPYTYDSNANDPDGDQLTYSGSLGGKPADYRVRLADLAGYSVGDTVQTLLLRTETSISNGGGSVFSRVRIVEPGDTATEPLIFDPSRFFDAAAQTRTLFPVETLGDGSVVRMTDQGTAAYNLASPITLTADTLLEFTFATAIDDTGATPLQDHHAIGLADFNAASPAEIGAFADNHFVSLSDALNAHPDTPAAGDPYDPAWPAGTDFDVTADTGIVTFNPTSDIADRFVEMRVIAAESATVDLLADIQHYAIAVNGDPTNLPPQITKLPQTRYVIPGTTSPISGDVSLSGTSVSTPVVSTLAPGEILDLTNLQVLLPTSGGTSYVPPVAPADALTVFNETDPQELLAALLGSGGAGISVTSINVDGNSLVTSQSSTGIFVNNNNTYDLGPYGIVISTGDAEDYGSGEFDLFNQNDPTDTGYGSDRRTTAYGTSATTDQQALLFGISGVSTHRDVTQIDIHFDVDPGVNNLFFNVAIGSEEWSNFVGGPYIDAFGLFITDHLGNQSNIAEVDAFGPADDHVTRSAGLVPFSIEPGEFIGSEPINVNHPQFDLVPGTELNGVLKSGGSPSITFSTPVEPSSIGNVMTFIIADTQDSSWDTTAYITSFGGTSPDQIDIEIVSSTIAGSGILQVVSSDGTGKLPGESAAFDVALIGDGQAYAFDLLLRDVNDPTRVFGSVPVQINASYLSDVDAQDPDGDELSYAFIDTLGNEVSTLHGAAINSVNGKITWEPSTPGIYDFIVQASDGRGGVDRESYSVTVEPTGAGNASPVIESTAPDEAAVGREYVYQVDASDPDDDTLNFYTIGATPAGMSIDPETGLLTWTPLSDQAQTYDFTIRVTDGNGGFDDELVSIVTSPADLVSNQVPNIDSVAGRAVLRGDTYRYEVMASDADGDKLTYVLEQKPSNAVIDPDTGVISWDTSEVGESSEDFLVRVDDGRGGSGFEFFTVNVIQPNADPVISTTPMTPARVGVDQNLNAQDPEASGDQPYVFTFEVNDPNGDEVFLQLLMPEVLTNSPDVSFNASTGEFTWTSPQTPANTVTNYGFLLRAFDGRGGFDEAEFTLAVHPDAPPTLVFPAGQAPVFDPSLGTQAAWDYQLDAQDDEDAIGNGLTFAIDPLSRTRGFDVDQDGLVTWTPDSPVGQTITITVTDSHGNSTTGSQYIPVVTPTDPGVNEAPEITSEDPQTAAHNRTWSYLLETDDPEGSPVTINVVSAPSWYSGPISGTGTLAMSGTPMNSGDSPIYETFELTLSDGVNTVDVTLQLPVLPNVQPYFVSGPASATLELGNEFVFDLSLIDFDADTVTLDVVSPAPGFGRYLDDNGVDLITQIAGTSTDPTNPSNIKFAFTPEIAGKQTLTLRAADSENNSDLLTIDLDIIDTADLPPDLLLSVPQTVFVGDTLDTTPQRLDTEGDRVTYALLDANGNEVTTIGASTWLQDAAGNAIPGVAPTGLSIDPQTGRVTWTPEIDQVTDSSDDPYRFTVVAKDARNRVTLGPATLTVAELPVSGGSSPIFVSGVPAPIVPIGQAITLPFEIIDFGRDDGVTADNISLSYSLTGASFGVTFSPATSSIPASADPQNPTQFDISFTPDVAGDLSLTVIATDDDNITASYPIALTVLPAVVPNQPPIGSVRAREVAAINQPFIAKAFAEDLDGIPDGGGIRFQLLDHNGNPVDQIPDPGVASSVPVGMQIDSLTGEITWTPTAAQESTEPYFYTVVIDDDDNAANGQSIVRDIPITVLNRFYNLPPSIDSTPDGIEARSGNPLIYNPVATDPEGDPLTWRLSEDSADVDGLSIDRDTGTLVWLPTVAQRNTTQPVTIIVEDPYGGFDQQPLNLQSVYIPGNTSPRIISTPPDFPDAAAEQPLTYQYAFRAVDDEGDAITFSIEDISAQSAGTIRFVTTGPESAEFVWEAPPSTPATVSVLLKATDARGLTSSQTLTLSYSGSGSIQRLDTPPNLIGLAPTLAAVGQPYTYQVVAEDPDVAATGDITYSFTIDRLNNGVPAGSPAEIATLTTGEVNELFAAADAGDYLATVTATQNGVSQGYTFTLQVVDPAGGNPAPALQPKSNLTATVGTTFTTRLSAINLPTSESVTFFLVDDADNPVSAHNGFSITPDGQVSWEAPAAFDASAVPAPTRAFTAIAQDGAGQWSAPVEYTFEIVADQAPDVTLVPYNTSPAPDETIVFTVYASDPDGQIFSRSLELATVDSQGVRTPLADSPISVPANGVVTVDLSEYNLNFGDVIEAVGTATDNTGQVGTSEPITVTVTEPSYIRPRVQLDTLLPITVTGVTPLEFTVTDEELDITRVYVTATPKLGGAPIVLYDPTPNITDVSASYTFDIDPLTLANGTYRFDVLAIDDPNQSPAGVYFDVTVDSQAKLGEFSLSFTDMVVPVAGFPLAVQRDYSTTQTHVDGDFGPGWSLDLVRGGATIEDSITTNFGFGDANFGEGLRVGSRIQIELPGGETLGYTISSVPYEAVGEQPGAGAFVQRAGLPYVAVVFQPDFEDRGNLLEFGSGYGTRLPNSYDDILGFDGKINSVKAMIGVQAPDGRIMQGTFGSLGVIDDFGFPQDTSIFGPLRLTARDGTVYQFDVKTGSLNEIQDPYGNSIDLTGNDIVTKDRQGEVSRIEIERNNGRITQVTNALGFRVQYEYDPSTGDLIKVTEDIDQPLPDESHRQRVTRFEYSSVHDHYLENIILEDGTPNGTVIAAAEYGNNPASDDFARMNRLTSSDDDLSAPVQDVSYDPVNRKQTTTSSFGGSGDDVVSIADYNEDGNVTQIVQQGDVNDPNDDIVWSYAYDNPDFPDLVTRQTDPLGRDTLYEYDEFGLLERVTAVDGTVTTYGYTDEGLIRRITDESTGRTEFRSYNDAGDLTSLYDETGYVFASWNYDSNGRLLTETDESGTTRYEYDGGRYPVRTILPTGEVIEATYDALGQVDSFTSDGELSTLALDAFGRTTQAVYDVGGPDELVVDYVYDRNPEDMNADDGLADDWTRINSASTGPINRQLTPSGQLAGWVNEDGSRTEYTYDNGRLFHDKTYVDDNGTDVLVSHTQYNYDDFGRVERVTDVITGLYTQTTYDALGRVLTTSVFEPNNPTPVYTTTTTHEDREEIFAPGPVSVSDSLGAATVFSYYTDGDVSNPAGQDNGLTVTQQTQLLSVGGDGLPGTADDDFRTTRVEYDAAGLPVAFVNNDGSRRTIEYRNRDVLNDTAQAPLRLIDEAGRVRAYTYDDTGRLQTSADLAGNTLTLNYDDQDRLESIVLPTVPGNGGDQLRIDYTYDADDNLVSTTRAGLGTTTILRFGDANDPELVQLPHGDHLRLTYDDNDNGPATNTGQLIKREVITGATLDTSGPEPVLTGGTVVESFSYTYLPGGLPHTVTNDLDTTTTTYTYEYQVPGRPVTQRLARIDLPNGTAVEYEYDIRGRTSAVTAFSSPSDTTGLKTSYDYDAAGRITHVWDPANPKGQAGSVATVYTYDVAGRLSTRTLPNDVQTTWTFDERDRITLLEHRDLDTDTVIESFEYRYTTDGTDDPNTTSEPRRITRADDSYTEYDYDAALRLIEERHYDASDVLQTTIAYTYDAAGNRLSRTVTDHLTPANSNTETYASDAQSAYRLDTVTHTDGSIDDFTLDSAGRTTDIDRDGVSLDLTYNAAGQVTGVDSTPNGGATASETYTYDAAGNRLEAGSMNYAVAPPVQSLGVDIGLRYLQTDGTDTTGFIYAGENPIGIRNADGTMSYVLEDAMDSIIGLTDTSGAFVTDMSGMSVARFTYDAFGNVLSSSSPLDFTAGLGYHAAWHDANGLIDMRARVYDPQTGRFLSVDPIEPQPEVYERFNPFMFANQNPMVFSDPTGGKSLAEINITQAINNAQLALKQQGIQAARREIVNTLREVAVDALADQLVGFIPIPEFARFAANQDTAREAGNEFHDGLDRLFESVPFAENAYLEPVVSVNGEPKTDGLNAGSGDGGRGRRGGSRNPDVIFRTEKSGPFTGKDEEPSWLIGEFKLRVATVYNDYFREKPRANKPEQWKAISNYSKKYSFAPIALILTWDPGNKIVTREILKQALKDGTYVVLRSLRPGKKR
ncbi:MAG: putative Ig domain-containing protein [Planctomycetota bacterium]